MTFWMGVILGTGFGALFCSLFYMFVIKWALAREDKTKGEFQKIQAANGEHIARIADAIEKIVKGK